MKLELSRIRHHRSQPSGQSPRWDDPTLSTRVQLARMLYGGHAR